MRVSRASTGLRLHGAIDWLTLLLITALLLALLLFFSLPSRAFAIEPRAGDTVVVGPTETLDDDLYVGSGSTDIRGTVRGDVVAVGGEHRLDGWVTGDVTVGGGTVVVTGRVDGSVRAAGGTVLVNGAVADDVIVAGGTVRLGPDARIGRDVVVGADSAILAGTVGRNVWAGTRDLTLDGMVGGNVQAQAETVSLTPRAAVAGLLTYASQHEAVVADGARTNGLVRQTPDWVRAEPTALERFGAATASWLRATIGLLAFGLLYLWLAPRNAHQTTLIGAEQHWASLGVGAAVLVTTPLVIVLLIGVGLVVGGWWLGLLLAAAYAGALALGFVATALLVGAEVPRRLGRPIVGLRWQLAAGVAALTLVGMVPVAGWAFGLLAASHGLGALAIATAHLRTAREPARPGSPTREAATPEPPSGVAVPSLQLAPTVGAGQPAARRWPPAGEPLARPPVVAGATTEPHSVAEHPSTRAN